MKATAILVMIVGPWGRGGGDFGSCGGGGGDDRQESPRQDDRAPFQQRRT